VKLLIEQFWVCYFGRSFLGIFFGRSCEGPLTRWELPDEQFWLKSPGLDFREVSADFL
jgi:hypothetical protein